MKKQVNENKDFIDIPTKDIKPTSVPGVFRVEPTSAFIKWAAHQRLILIVPPRKEEYEEWKRIAAKKPDGWHAKVIALPENQDLLLEVA